MQTAWALSLKRLQTLINEFSGALKLLKTDEYVILSKPYGQLALCVGVIVFVIACIESYIFCTKPKRNATVPQPFHPTKLENKINQRNELLKDSKNIADANATENSLRTPIRSSKKSSRKIRSDPSGQGESLASPITGTSSTPISSSVSSFSVESNKTQIMTPSVEKIPKKVPVETFLRQLVTLGLECRKQKVAGTSPNPKATGDKNKSLRMKADGKLYFHHDGFKFFRMFHADELWDVRELASAVEGESVPGEVYLEFINPHSLKSRILSIFIDNHRYRKIVVEQFNDLVSNISSHPDWIFDVIRQSASTTGTKSGLAPTSPSFSEAGQSSPAAKVSVTHSSVRGSIGGGSSKLFMGVDASNPVSFADPYIVNEHTNFHEWMNKELMALILREGIEHEVRVNKDRQDLIRVLETHMRIKAGKPIVKVNYADFEGQLRAIYQRFNPTKIAEIPKMVGYYQGKEKYILEAILDKYAGGMTKADLPLFGARPA